MKNFYKINIAGWSLLIHFFVLIDHKDIWERWLIGKIVQNYLEILLLLYNLHIFAPDQTKEESKKMFFFCFLLEQLLSNFRYKKQLFTFLSNVLRNCMRATFWEMLKNIHVVDFRNTQKRYRRIPKAAPRPPPPSFLPIA